MSGGHVLGKSKNFERNCIAPGHARGERIAAPAGEVFGLGLSNTGGSIKIFSENEVFLQLSSLMDGQSCDSIDRIVTDERAPVEGCVVNPLSSITMMS